MDATNNLTKLLGWESVKLSYRSDHNGVLRRTNYSENSQRTVGISTRPDLTVHTEMKQKFQRTPCVGRLKKTVPVQSSVPLRLERRMRTWSSSVRQEHRNPVLLQYHWSETLDPSQNYPPVYTREVSPPRENTGTPVNWFHPGKVLYPSTPVSSSYLQSRTSARLIRADILYLLWKLELCGTLVPSHTCGSGGSCRRRITFTGTRDDSDVTLREYLPVDTTHSGSVRQPLIQVKTLP